MRRTPASVSSIVSFRRGADWAPPITSFLLIAIGANQFCTSNYRKGLPWSLGSLRVGKPVVYFRISELVLDPDRPDPFGLAEQQAHMTDPLLQYGPIRLP